MGNTKNINELAKRIRYARTNAHLSQSELGDAVGVSDKSVSAYEQGRAVPPLEKLRRIAESTHQPLQYFMEDTTEEILVQHKLALIEKELIEIRDLLQKIDASKQTS